MEEGLGVKKRKIDTREAQGIYEAPTVRNAFLPEEESTVHKCIVLQTIEKVTVFELTGGVGGSCAGGWFSWSPPF